MGVVLALYIVRAAAEKAFEKCGRSLTGLGVLDELEQTIKEIEKK